MTKLSINIRGVMEMFGKHVKTGILMMFCLQGRRRQH